MKRSILFFAALLVVLIMNGQTAEEIVKKYSVANKLDKIGQFTTIKTTGKMTMQGMDIPIVTWMKKPDKMRMEMSIMGQQMITTIDGTKGYMLNPMAGSEPTELPMDQIEQNSQNNVFNNYMENYLKKGKLTYVGAENVGDKPAFKLKLEINATTTAMMFIDKVSYLLVKTSVSTAQGSADMIYSDFKDNNGVFLPMKTTTSAMGQEMVMSVEKVEVNIPMEDTLFKLK